MKYLVVTLAFFLVPAAAYATPVPSPEMDFGMASLVMIAGAAYFAARKRG